MMNVTDPISLAAGHANRVLFRSFDLGKWFAFGLIFFLEQLLEGGSSTVRWPGSFGAPPAKTGTSGGPVSPFPIDTWLHDGRAWMTAHASEIVVYGAIASAVVIALGVVFVWLACRGQMMAVHAVARAEAHVTEAWRATREAGWALFRFRLVFLVVAIALWAPLGVLLVLRVVTMAEAPGGFDLRAVLLGVAPFLVVGVLLAAMFALVECFLRGFVVPMMLHFRIGALEGWRRLFTIAGHYPVQMAGYVVIRIALSIAIALIGTVATFVTCCIGALPVLHQTLLAPVFVFDRAYSLYVLASLGPEYQMIRPEPPPPAWLPPYPTG